MSEKPPSQIKVEESGSSMTSSGCLVYGGCGVFVHQSLSCLFGLLA